MNAKKDQPALSPANDDYTWDDLVALTGLDSLGEVHRDSRGRPFVYLVNETKVLVDTDAEGYVHVDDTLPVRTNKSARARLNPNGTITVIFINSTKETGLSSPGGAGPRRRWWAWKNVIEYAMTARPDGTWLKLSPGKFGFFSFVLTGESAWEAHETLLEALPEPEPSLTTYPVLGHYFEPVKARQGMYGNHRGSADDPMWTSRVRRAASGARDAREFTAGLFGKTRVRKDLVKAVAGADLSRICMAEAFRGLVPVDWIVTYLRRGEVRFGHARRVGDDAKTTNIYPDVRPLLRRLDERSLRGLLRDEDPRQLLIVDTLKMHVDDYDPTAPLPRCRTWNEVHQALVTRTNLYGHLARARGKVDDKPIKHTDEALALEAKAGDIEIVLALHEDDLYSWGQSMNHCIATYGRHMRGRRNVYGAVYAGNRLMGNFEISGLNPSHDAEIRQSNPSNPVLRQLLGHSNTVLPVELQREVVAHFASRDVAVDRYWGEDRSELDHALGRVPQEPDVVALPVLAGAF